MQRAQQRLREDGRQPVGQLATAGGEAGQAVALSSSALSVDDARNQGESTGRCPRTDGDVTRSQSSEALDLSFFAEVDRQCDPLGRVEVRIGDDQRVFGRVNSNQLVVDPAPSEPEPVSRPDVTRVELRGLLQTGPRQDPHGLRIARVRGD